MRYGWVHKRLVCPLLLSPANGATGVGTNPFPDQPVPIIPVDLEWGTVSGATYNIYLDDVLQEANWPDTTYQIVVTDFNTEFTWKVTAVVDGVESTGCGEYTFTTLEEVMATAYGWDPATLTANTNLTNNNLDLDSTVDDYYNRSCLSLPRSSSNLVYAEVWLPGVSFVEDAYSGFTNDPIQVGLVNTGILGLSFRPSEQATVPIAVSLLGLYIEDDSLTTYSGAIEIYQADTYYPALDLLRFNGEAGGSHRRIGLAWDVVNGFLYVSQGGVWMYGNADGGSSPKPHITLAGAPTDLRIYAWNFVSARGSFTAADMTYAIPAGYTAWDGTT